MTAQPYWIDDFERVCKDGPAWTAYSNERVQPAWRTVPNRIQLVLQKVGTPTP